MGFSRLSMAGQGGGPVDGIQGTQWSCARVGDPGEVPGSRGGAREDAGRRERRPPFPVAGAHDGACSRGWLSSFQRPPGPPFRVFRARMPGQRRRGSRQRRRRRNGARRGGTPQRRCPDPQAPTSHGTEHPATMAQVCRLWQRGRQSHLRKRDGLPPFIPGVSPAMPHAVARAVAHLAPRQAGSLLFERGRGARTPPGGCDSRRHAGRQSHQELGLLVSAFGG